jgi:hypothetical protein
MLISECIRQLQDIQAKFGDIAITGGFMQDDMPLSDICVTDSEGMEVYPRDPNGVAGKHAIDGVMFSS